MDNSYDSKPSQDNKTVAALTHILGFLTWIFGPIIVYFASDDDFVKENAANAFSWQIFLTVYISISFLLIFFIVGLISMFLLPVLNLVFCTVATIKAMEGESWKYPATIDLFGHTQEQERIDRYTTVDEKREKIENKSRNKERDHISKSELFEMYLDGKITEEQYERRIRHLRQDKEKDDNLEYN